MARRPATLGQAADARAMRPRCGFKTEAPPVEAAGTEPVRTEPVKAEAPVPTDPPERDSNKPSEVHPS